MLIFGLLMIVQCTEGDKKKEKTEKDNTENVAPGPVKKQKPELVYDDRGNVIERHGYSYRKTDGSIRSRDSYYYTYDDRDNVIKEIKESYNPDGSLKFKNVNYYQYDDRNLKIDLVFESYNEAGEMQRTAHHSYKYNENGHKIEDIGYAENGDVISRIILSPDEDGLLRAEEYIYYDENGEIKDHKKYYYTEYGLEKTVDLLEDKE
jgi:hypothetical protein